MTAAVFSKRPAAEWTSAHRVLLSNRLMFDFLVNASGRRLLTAPRSASALFTDDKGKRYSARHAQKGVLQIGRKSAFA